ncbi:hypothetical protein, partial [Endozoicomonas sp. SESOKO2]|uniref:hypothetical protein n=2 Tax=unclassified Endozoicomonas TaxID=2644528 RepID=UPI00214819F1
PECKDRIIKHSFFAAMLLMLLSLSVSCSAGSLTRRFIFEHRQDVDSLKQNFSIKRDWHTLSGNPSDIADINDDKETDLAHDKKRHRSFSYGIKKNIIESISWQWLYATNLLIACELILNTEAHLSVTPYFWLPVEVDVAAGWLLKNYSNPDTKPFDPIEQQANQGHPFATITAVFGSGNNPPQCQSSESPSQQAPQTTLPPISSFISPFNNGYSGGNGGHQQHQHTLGLNCFTHPCHGSCHFRLSSNSSEPADWPMNRLESSWFQLPAGHCLSDMGHFDPANAMASRQNPLFNTLNDLSDIQLSFDSEPLFDGTDSDLEDSIQNAIDATVSLNDDAPLPGYLSSIADDVEVINRSLNLQSLPEEDGMAFTLNYSETQHTTSKSSQLDQSRPDLSQTGAAQATVDSDQRICEETVVAKDGQPGACGKVCKNARALMNHKGRYHTGQKNCDVTVVGKDGQSRPCGKVCKNADALVNHKNRYHSEQKICEAAVVGKDGQSRPCGRLCKSVGALATHRSGFHTGQKTCDVTVVGEDCQQQPCGKLFKNARALSDHKSLCHGEQRTCEVIVVAEHGQPRPCGKPCKNARALRYHKKQDHCGRKVCKVIMVGKDGRQRPCGKYFKNVQALSTHKSGYHSGERTCDMSVVGAGGQQRPCGRVCKNSKALSNHKYAAHRGQKFCDVTECREDDQQRPSGKAYKNSQCLWDHKRRHRKRKPVDLNEDDELSPSADKVNKCEDQGKLTD